MLLCYVIIQRHLNTAMLNGLTKEFVELQTLVYLL